MTSRFKDGFGPCNEGWRRGLCPTLSAPMATGDGWLARLPPLPRGLSPAEVIVLCEAAERLGNGILEITRRGNLQLRGLDALDVGRLPRALAGPGSDTSATALDRELLDQRGPAITLDPLMDHDATLSDVERTRVLGLRRRLLEAAVEGLAPKVAVVIDAGGSWPGLDELSADLRIHLCRDSDGEPRGWLGLAGDSTTVTWLGDIGLPRLLDGAIALLEAIAACGPRARARDLLVRRSPLMLADRLGLRPAIAYVRARPPARPETNGAMQALEILWPFGQCEATALLRLTRIAQQAGARLMAPGPGRRWRLMGGTAMDVTAIAHQAQRLGMIVDPDDPRLRLATCVGAAGCERGQVITRALAGRIATAGAPLCDGSVTLHFAGCGKGCARSEPATLTLTGTAAGLTLGLEACAGDSGRLLTLPAEALPERMAALTERVVEARQPAESMRDALMRLGVEQLAQWLEVPSH